MGEYKHSVFLNIDKCKGCTTCLRRCPTEAIRIRDGHAVINSDCCIDCGECIRLCPHKAKHARFDSLDDALESRKWVIALPAPSLYGQFDNLEDVDYVIQGLLDIGFDDVFEVAKAAELVSDYTRRYTHDETVKRPIISSACPVVVRLISLRFPYLCDHVIPLLPPMEVAGRMAREEALAAHPDLKPEDIATVFISPCPAKTSYVKNGFQDKTSQVDFVVSMSDVYFQLVKRMKKKETPQASSSSGMIGISWASTGGESSALMNDRYLAADGIENVIRVLENIETGNFPVLEFVELNACNGGCVGGVATVENPYIARVRLQTLRRYLPVAKNRLSPDDAEADWLPERVLFHQPLKYAPVSKLSEDRRVAMEMMAAIDKTFETLPQLDCGSCGSPTCRSFAEDVVKGECSIDECIVRMREQIHKKLREKGGESS